jgi:hypothetical protein
MVQILMAILLFANIGYGLLPCTPKTIKNPRYKPLPILLLPQLIITSGFAINESI